MKDALRYLLPLGLAFGWVCLTAKQKMNILFIPVDDLNHWVGYTGRNPQSKTPNIDRLSKMGVSFSNAHCAAPACEPTRASLFSGLRPSTSGCYLNGHSWKKYVKEGICLNATFKKSGYYVMGTGKTYHSSAGGKQGIYEDEWDEYPPLAKSSTGGASKYQAYFEPLPLKMKDEDLGDWHSVNYCIEQLGKKRDKPFFLACGMIKPHLPWAVPQKYYDMFPKDEIKLPPHIKNDFSDIPKIAHKIGVPGDHPKFLKTGRWKDAIQSYLATIAYVDVCIGRLLDALETSPHKDNTVIVLWGDHGWHLGEKERWRKFTLWEEATRAPLIWYAPGVTKANTVCSKPVDFMSIYPTLCELAGIDTPSHVEGKSLVPLLKDPKAKWNGVAVTTHGYMNHSVRNEHWRYIRYKDGSEELYDHRKDPYEWKNLAGVADWVAVKKRLATRLPQTNVPNTPIKKNLKKAKKNKKEG
jgi:arylsulfatase A-like enzyme